MVFNNDDRTLIKELRMAKGYGAKRFLKEFPLKNWSLAGLKRLIKNIDEYGSADRRPGSAGLFFFASLETLLFDLFCKKLNIL